MEVSAALDYFTEKRNTVAAMGTKKTISRELEKKASVFKALGHPARLQIVESLASGERCVRDLVELVGLGWSAVSRHLAVLKEAGVLDGEKRGLQVFYRVARPCVPTFTDCLETACKGEGTKAPRSYA